MPMPQTGNPVADELINLSPGAQSALMQGVDQHLATQQQAPAPGAIQTSAPPSQGPVPGAIPIPGHNAKAPMLRQEVGNITPTHAQQPFTMPEPPQIAPSALSATSVPQPPAEPPVPGAIPLPAGKPTGSMVGGMIPQANFTPQTPPHQAEFNRLSAPPQSGALAHTKADTGQSGIGQIHNPYARIPLQILDAVGSTFLPGLAAALPGTQLHHQFLLNNAEGAAKEEQGAAESGARQEREAAQTELEREQAKHQADQPPPTITTDKGILQWNPQTHAYDQTVGNAPPKEELEGKTVETADGIKAWNPKTHSYDTLVGDAPGRTNNSVQALPDGTVISINHDKKSGKSTAEVVYKGDPKIETDLTKLEISGKPHTVIVNKKTGEVIKDLGETGEKPPSVNVNAGLSALDRESTHFGKTHEKAVEAANAQLEKISEARSMLTTGNAESQALAVPKVLTALVSGQGTGVRITQPELNAISAARGLGGDFQAFISRVSSGKKLTPDQSQQLIGVLDAAAARLAQKREIANTALNGINGAKSRDEMAQLDKEARDKLAQFETGGHQAKVKVQIPGHEAAEIDADKLKAFQTKYPNAKVIQ